MFEAIEVQRRGAATIIRLNRPDALNAWDTTLATELLAAVQAVAADDAVRAVCVTGAGRAFSSGADLRELTGRPRTADGQLDAYTTLTTLYHPILTGLRTMTKPVLAAINGPAAGIGCSLALACDLLVAARSSYLLLASAHIGLVPDGGATALIAARCGGGRAMAMALRGERVGAPEALRCGLVDEVLHDDAFEDGVHALLDGLAAGPTASYAGSKRQLNAWLFAGLDEQFELEARIQQEMVASEDFAEGVASFLEKRDPEFRGR